MEINTQKPSSNYTGRDILCKVCGDRASGKHYGVLSCDGCRGFFKRSIRRDMKYVCKEDNKCIVDVSRRNQCQSCRFVKCLKSNMRKEAVQHERAPRAYNPELLHNFYARHQKCSSSDLILQWPIHQVSKKFFAPSYQSAFDPNPTLQTSLLHNSFNIGISQISGYPMECDFSNYPIKQSAATQLGHIAREDEVTSSMEIQQSMLDSQILSTQSDFIDREAIFESAAKLLFLSVKWAKSMPMFSQIPIADQTMLLEESWSELFVIAAAQYGLSIENILSPPDKRTQRLQSTIHRIQMLQMDNIEVACLKAIILFRPDAPELRSKQQISILQSQTIKLLLEKSGGMRMGNILLLIPTVKSAVNQNILQELLFKKTVGEVAIERLLGELIQN